MKFFNKIIYYIKQPEFRPSVYLTSIVIVLIGLSLFVIPGLWKWIYVSLLIITIFVMVAVNWRFSVVSAESSMSNAQIESIISHLNSGVIIYDTNFNVLIFNSASEQIFGISNKDAKSRALSADMASDPKYSLLVQSIFSSLAPKVVEETESGKYPRVINVIFDKPKRNLHIVTDRLYDSKGKIIGFVKIITDKTREISLIKSKTEFIGVAAHQLRTPLTAIDWSLEILSKSKDISGDDKSVVLTAFSAAKKMLKTVNDLLDISKIEDGKFGYDFKKVSLNQFLDNILEQSNVVAKQYGIKLYYNRPPKDIDVIIDSQKISMAIFNLLNNAVIYNVKNGSVTISAKIDKNPSFAMLSISDTGIGISEEDSKNIFTKFFRGERVQQFVPDGTGLGLYIVKNIILRHGGKIWFESEINRGTTFYLTLPLVKSVIPKRDLIEDSQI